MSRIDNILDELNDLYAANEESRKEAINDRKMAEQAIKDATKKECAAEENAKLIGEAKVKASEAKKKEEEAKKAADKATRKVTGLSQEEIDEKNKSTETGTKHYSSSSVGSLVLAALVLGGISGYVLSKTSKTGMVYDGKGIAASTIKDIPATIDSYDEGTTVTYNPADNTVDVITKGDTSEEEILEVEPTVEITQEEVYEELTTEKFEDAVANLAVVLNDKGVSLKTNDITKFVAIANIDKLVEDNPELASELFTVQSKEEYLNDAAKFIGASVMYGFTKWNETHSTDDFVKVSDIIVGDQKDNMLKIEDYTNKIADAVNKDDADKVNELVSEFLTDMNSGELSKLDDGVGFGAQVYIALISDGIAKDYINKQNFDMFQILKTSEKYVSNIFRVYDKCGSDTKTLTK